MKLKTNKERITLDGFCVKTGYHCESSAMMNALNYQGVDMSESMITGLGSAPAFFFNPKEAFPFLGGRANTMLENFCTSTGIGVEMASPKTAQEAYNAVKDVLKREIPVVLRVNMRYLPYLYGGKYGDKYVSFGAHYICLVKIDEVSSCAWVTDTTYGELQQVKLTDLAKARDTKEGLFPAGNCFYYFKNPSSVNIDYMNAFKKSLKVLIENYEAPDGGLKGLERLPDDLKSIEKGRNVFMLKPLFHTFYGHIEEFGSGGAAFRNFQRDYFYTMSERLGIAELKSAALIVDASCGAWKSLALGFKNISESLDNARKDKAARDELYEGAAQRAARLYGTEKAIYEEVKVLYGGC